MIPKKLALGLDPRVEPVFEKRAAATKNLDRDLIQSHRGHGLT
jgi:hypothetical protein